MLGNDLINLKATQQHTPKRFFRYLEKVFTVREREAIAASRFSFLHHLLWSAKEAAFKAYMQVHTDKEKFYAPKKFEVQLNNVGEDSAEGTVTYQKQRWFFTAQITDSYIHCIACVHEVQLHNVLFEIHLHEPHASRYLQHKTLGAVHLLNNKRGIPEPYVNQLRVEGYASVSHDGDLITYALLLAQDNVQ